MIRSEAKSEAKSKAKSGDRKAPQKRRGSAGGDAGRCGWDALRLGLDEGAARRESGVGRIAVSDVSAFVHRRLEREQEM
ncbi:hypothetical protein HPB52_018455 [Rhipicephalus sanguineus]|uniref:Uncharacterized protein n=1 Tax=Rhipicephalus sanguineus TaxID=34632 RepID=A0A9D4SUX1_RHISA|nr:hypothetical protein HPB52_018455 [Rhipicephalus sanguineus]